MGEHKHNPTAIAAKSGKILPKQKPSVMSVKELHEYVRKAMVRQNPMIGMMDSIFDHKKY